VRVGVIGCGTIARRAHLPALKSIDHVEIWAVADVNRKAAERVAKKFNIPNVYADYKDLLKDETIEAVSICAPSFSHAEIAVESAKAGKHILVEKPLAMNVKDAVKVVKSAKEHNVKLCCVFNYRYFPAAQKAKEIITNGNLGDIVSIYGIAHTHFPISWTRSTWLYHKGGALDDFGPHLIDMICWLNESEVEEVFALGGDFLGTTNFINYIQILMKFKNRSLAVADISWLTGSFLFVIDVHGTGGHLRLDVRYNHLEKFHGMRTPLDDFRSFRTRMTTITKDVISKKFFRGALAFYKQIYEDFILSIEKGIKPPITGEEGLRVTAISEAAKISLAENRPVNISDLIKNYLDKRDG